MEVTHQTKFVCQSGQCGRLIEDLRLARKKLKINNEFRLLFWSLHRHDRFRGSLEENDMINQMSQLMEIYSRWNHYTEPVSWNSELIKFTIGWKRELCEQKWMNNDLNWLKDKVLNWVSKHIRKKLAKKVEQTTIRALLWDKEVQALKQLATLRGAKIASGIPA